MRQFPFPLIFVLAFVIPCPGQPDETRPNRLTPREIADGWLLLFDGKSSTGWDKNGWNVGIGELVSPGDNSPLRSNREFKDFELRFEFKNDGGKEATLGFGKYSERDSHPVRILLSGNHPGWQKIKLTAEGTQAAGIIESLDTDVDPTFPEAVIRADKSTPVPLVFKGAALRLRNIKIRPINIGPKS